MAEAPTRHDPDVLVVGGGVVGLFCAYYLRRSGASVTVIEDGPIGGPQSCSSGNTGFVGTQGTAPLAEPGVLAQGLRWLLNPTSPLRIRPLPSRDLASWLWQFRRRCNEADARACSAILLELKRRSLAILREICGQPGLAGTFTVPGMIVAFKTARGFDRACQSVPSAVSLGVPLRVLSRAELAELEPGVAFDVQGALFNAEGAALRTPEFVVEFADCLRELGVEVIADVAASRFDVTGIGVTGREIRQVRTSTGDFAPCHVVIAAGSGSARLARMLGIRLALQPAKGYAITVDTPPAAPRLPVLLSEGKVAVMPLGDRLRFGGTLELASADAHVASRRVDGIAATVCAYLPGLDVTASRQVWTGVRGCTPDSLPFLDRGEPYRNLSIACGHGYIGMGLAPVSGRLIAQLVAGERPELDLAPFRVGRFGGR